MKTIKLLTFSLIVFLYSGCKDELFDLKFNMPTMEAKYTLKAQDTMGLIELLPVVERINLDSMAAANGTDLSKLKSLKAEKITVMIESPATANFDILDSGELWVSTGTMGDPDFDLLKVRLIAFGGILKGARQFDITPADVELLDLAKKPKFTIFGKLWSNSPYSEDITLKVLIETKVVANPIKK